MQPNELLTGSAHNMSGGCGIVVFSDFLIMNKNSGWSDTPLEDAEKDECPNHAGFGIAAFVNTPACKEAYMLLSKQYRITYQSPVRVNHNTSNNFFFCTYDLRS